MKIISRYITKEFLKALLFTIMVFVGLYVIAELVDDMRSFVNHKPSISLVILFYLYQIPYFMVQVLPLAVLLSTLFSLGQLGRNNELVALRACGVSFLKIAMPILITALSIVGMVMIFNEIVIPYTNPRAYHIKRVNIEHKSDETFRYRRDWLTRSVSGRRILHTQHLNAQTGKMFDVMLLKLDKKRDIIERLDAPQASWKDGHWIFQNGTLRAFDDSGAVNRYLKFDEYKIPFRESPIDFIRQKKDDDLMLATPIKELQTQINLLREMGTDPRAEEVNYHLKIAFPFSNFILALLGVALPFIFPTGRRAIVGTAIGFVITIVTGFFYIGFIAVGTSFGKNGTLPPFLSVWIANFIFLGLGVFLITKAKS
ncbi:LPS export ABC transporter permease LptG [bacterium]|nr:LPS export ABC transporter permease LptG [bacterium]